VIRVELAFEILALGGHEDENAFRSEALEARRSS